MIIINKELFFGTGDSKKRIESRIREVDNSIADTTLRLRDAELWRRYLDADQAPYTKDVINLAERWGKYMQNLYDHSRDGSWDFINSFGDASLPRIATIEELWVSPALKLLLETMDLRQGLHQRLQKEILRSFARPDIKSERPIIALLNIINKSMTLEEMASIAVDARSGLPPESNLGLPYRAHVIPVEANDTAEDVVAKYSAHLLVESESAKVGLAMILEDRPFVDNQFPNIVWPSHR